MSILEGVKACNYKGQKPRFVIKPKLSAKDNRQQIPLQQLNATDADVIHFIEYMIGKSVRLKELIEKKAVHNQENFYEKHLLNSICLKTIIKQVLDKMMSDRRLGRNLKGMNKSNLNEIQNGIWGIVEREANLYHNDLDYTKQKQQLKADLKRRKEQLLYKIEKLGFSEKQNQDCIMLTENVLNEQ